MVACYLTCLNKKKVNRLVTLKCQECSFSKKSRQNPGEVEEVSVADYYWEVYKHRLKYPNAPALDVGSKKKPTYIPLELCKIIEGQRYTKALSRMQRQKQIEIGKQSPQDRRHVCEDVILIHLLDCVATPT
jgi:eukaryotic translation initiation factor 2C